MREPDPEVLRRLDEQGLIRFEDGVPRATRRWQAAMARASLALLQQQAPDGDLRLPVIYALVELFGPDEPPDAIADLVEIMLPIQRADLCVWPEESPAP